jgi:arabinan endo-1,5-alpha-L-arabinosidase
MNKQNIKYWMMATACVGLLTTATGCSDDDHPDKSIPAVPEVSTPVVSDTQVLGPANLQRVVVHDPSVVYDPSSWSYYIFGSHRAVAKSPNLMSWSTVNVPWGKDGVSGVGNDVAFTEPEVTSVTQNGHTYTLPAFNAMEWSKKGNASYNIDGNMWAPDVIYNKAMKKWCMYMSINGDAWYSSIVLLTSDYITGPYTYQAPVVISGFYDGDNYKETDLHLAINNGDSLQALPARYAAPWAATDKPSYPNCIDPCVFYDEQGKLWMSYGSWSGGIFMLELDEATGLRDYTVSYATNDTSDAYFGKKIAGGYYVSGEASYIEYIGGYYWLFMSYGGFGAADGYQMRVFRSENPDGPYVDSKGSSPVFSSYLLNFGANANDGNRGVNIFGAYGEWGGQAVGAWSERSQGHNSVIAAPDGRAYVVYHTRFQDQAEGHQVRVHQLYLNEDNWLVAAPFEYTGEMAKTADIATKQIIPTANIPGNYKLLIHRYKLDNAAKELATPIDIVLNADGTVTGARTGTWSITEGKSYITLSLGGNTYKGVITLQTLEPDNTQVPAFSALDKNTGITVWGYKVTEE